MDELDKLFLLYLEEALCIFEEPHNYNNAERLDQYRKAFHKVVGDALKEKEK